MPDGRTLRAHVRVQALVLWRSPAFLAPTILLPVAFYLLFGRPVADGPAEEAAVLAAFAAFGVLGVALFDFGVGIAIERVDPWEAYLRTLPVSPAERLGARVLASILFASMAAAPVLVAGLLGGVELPPARLALVLVALAGGSVPFVLMGIALGYLVSERGALAVANLLHLGLALLGGLLRTPVTLDATLARIGRALPSGLWAELLGGAAAAGRVETGPVLGLALWTAALGALARWAYRRDEGRQHR